MAGNPNQATVDVTILPGQTPNFSFSTKSNNIQIGPNNEITFENNGKPGFVIDYHLDNPPNGYVFPDNPIPNHLNEALWSAVGSNGCPGVAGQWPQFVAKKVKNNGLTLEVRNLNESVDQFGYVLRVTNNNGVTYLPLDPGGFNQNGEEQMQMSLLVAGVIGAIAGSLLTLGAQALLNA